MSILVDTHCHLDLDEFNADRDQVIQKAKQAGVEILINPGIDGSSSQKALDIASRNQNIFSAAGIHPNDIRSGWQDEILKIETLLTQPKVVAIGEIGLDMHHKVVSLDLQVEVMQKQLNLALTFKKPVILHSRDTLKEITPVLSDWSAACSTNSMVPPYGVLHSFEGDIDEAREFIDLGFYIGLAGPVTYKNATIKHNLASLLPLSCIVLETDSPFLPPVPFRGLRNQPAFLPQIAEKTAIIRGCAVEEVKQVTTQNAIKLFHLGVSQ